jgi:superfamily II DNA or RNA helicase
MTSVRLGTEEDEEPGLVAIGVFFGEGFDYARLATLFLALPISWRGTLAQYAGRLHRPHATKREVLVYVDVNEPMIAKMAAKRETGYRSLGYRKADEAELCIGTAGRSLQFVLR